MLMPFLLKKNKVWKQCKLRIFAVAQVCSQSKFHFHTEVSNYRVLISPLNWFKLRCYCISIHKSFFVPNCVLNKSISSQYF